MEVGKWYKDKGDSKWLMYITNVGMWGFDWKGEWFQSSHSDTDSANYEAYVDEVLERLIELAVVKGCNKDSIFELFEGSLKCDGKLIMDRGVWLENTATLKTTDSASSPLNYNLIESLIRKHDTNNTILIKTYNYINNKTKDNIEELILELMNEYNTIH